MHEGSKRGRKKRDAEGDNPGGTSQFNRSVRFFDLEVTVGETSQAAR